MTKATTRVAVIGAGATGLTQLKQLVDAYKRPNVTSQLQVVMYESRNAIGGSILSQTPIDQC